MAEVIGTVKNTSIGKNKDGTKDVRLLQVEISESIDIQTVELFSQAGEDYNPPIGSQVIVISIGSSWKIGIAIDDGILPEAEKGARRLYSIDGNGDIAALINLLVNGEIELNGNNDFAVRFSKLETALNNQNDLINAELGKIATGIAGAGGAYTPGTITTDISAAKVEEVKLS